MFLFYVLLLTLAYLFLSKYDLGIRLERQMTQLAVVTWRFFVYGVTFLIESLRHEFGPCYSFNGVSTYNMSSSLPLFFLFDSLGFE